jgi:hypothetical protein
MTQKTSQPKGKNFKLPVQKLSGKSLKTKTEAFRLKHKKPPTALVLQFEIDLNLLLRNKYYLIGYLKSGTGRNTTFGKKIIIPKEKEKETTLTLEGDRIAFGTIVVPYKKLIKLLSKNSNLVFTPILHPNPHAGYDINGEAFYPSPPAAPNF